MRFSITLVALAASVLAVPQGDAKGQTYLPSLMTARLLCSLLTENRCHRRPRKRRPGYGDYR
jgi:hypothetical protein